MVALFLVFRALFWLQKCPFVQKRHSYFGFYCHFSAWSESVWLWQNVGITVETSREARRAGFARFWAALASENARFVWKMALSLL